MKSGLDMADPVVGSYVVVNELSRNKTLRDLHGRVVGVKLRGSVPYAQVAVIGLEDHLQGDQPMWWLPALVLTCVDESVVDPSNISMESSASGQTPKVPEDFL